MYLQKQHLNILRQINSLLDRLPLQKAVEFNDQVYKLTMKNILKKKRIICLAHPDLGFRKGNDCVAYLAVFPLSRAKEALVQLTRAYNQK